MAGKSAAGGKSISKTLVWILMALLILGLGGFGVTNLSGNIRSIGSVGGKDISTTLYARALQDDIRAISAQTGQSMTFGQAQAIGLDRSVLTRLIAVRALDHETEQLGLSVGDATLQERLLEVPGFRGIDGNFDREAYRFGVQQAGLSEAEFEATLREEAARGLVQSAVVSGLPDSTTFTNTLISFVAERRNFSWARLDQGDLAEPLPQASKEQLKAYHQSHLPDFTLPEMKHITYAWLAPETLLGEIEVDEATLRAQYEERSAEFNQPERRLVERLAFSDQAEGEAAKAALEAGDKNFEDLVGDRGLALSDVDLGDIARDDLGEAAAAVFSADVGGVVGPFESAVGPALFRVNGVLAERSKSFEEARDQLNAAQAIDSARRLIETQIEDINDRLAGGATVEDLADETDMSLFTVDYHSATGSQAAGFEGFRAVADIITLEDFPEVIQLADGGIVAMRMDKVIEPRIQPLEDVIEEAVAGWETQETETRLNAQAEDLLKKLSEGASMESLGLVTTVEVDQTRGSFVNGTPGNFMETIFTLESGDITMLQSFGAVLIVRLDTILPADDTNEEVAQLRATLNEQARNGLAQDLFLAFANDAQTRAGLTLDQSAINAVNANFQ